MFLFNQHALKTKDNLEITTQWQQAQNDYVFQSVKFLWKKKILSIPWACNTQISMSSLSFIYHFQTMEQPQGNSAHSWVGMGVSCISWQVTRYQGYRDVPIFSNTMRSPCRDMIEQCWEKGKEARETGNSVHCLLKTQYMLPKCAHKHCKIHLLSAHDHEDCTPTNTVAKTASTPSAPWSWNTLFPVTTSAWKVTK